MNRLQRELFNDKRSKLNDWFNAENKDCNSCKWMIKSSSNKWYCNHKNGIGCCNLSKIRKYY